MARPSSDGGAGGSRLSCSVCEVRTARSKRCARATTRPSCRASCSATSTSATVNGPRRASAAIVSTPSWRPSAANGTATTAVRSSARITSRCASSTATDRRKASSTERIHWVPPLCRARTLGCVADRRGRWWARSSSARWARSGSWCRTAGRTRPSSLSRSTTHRSASRPTTRPASRSTVSATSAASASSRAASSRNDARSAWRAVCSCRRARSSAWPAWRPMVQSRLTSAVVSVASPTRLVEVDEVVGARAQRQHQHAQPSAVGAHRRDHQLRQAGRRPSRPTAPGCARAQPVVQHDRPDAAGQLHGELAAGRVAQLHAAGCPACRPRAPAAARARRRGRAGRSRPGPAPPRVRAAPRGCAPR